MDAGPSIDYLHIRHHIRQIVPRNGQSLVLVVRELRVVLISVYQRRIKRLNNKIKHKTKDRNNIFRNEISENYLKIFFSRFRFRILEIDF